MGVFQRSRGSCGISCKYTVSSLILEQVFVCGGGGACADSLYIYMYIHVDACVCIYITYIYNTIIRTTVYVYSLRIRMYT
jgi:hypothetical protein